jgi:hypothetical protein
MRFPFKNYPLPKGEMSWWAVLRVQIANPAKHSPPTKTFEAIIDSGASECIFHSSIGKGIGLSIERGEQSQTQGVSGQLTTVYMHRVSLYVPGGHVLQIKASFSDEIPVAGILGISGFFENFKITFDPSSTPPGFELERIYRA